MKCDRGSYQPSVGKNKCFECAKSKTTKQHGTININDCYKVGK